MKKLFLILIVLAATGAWAQQSLGDAARDARAKQRPGSNATVRLEGVGVPDLSGKDSATADKAKDADQSADNKSADAKPADDKDKKKDTAKQKSDDWAKKIEDQKKEIASLQHELDIATREQRLRAANYYADAGTRLRDQGKFAEDSRKEQDEIDGKKKALTAAQQKLADLEEQARKAAAF